MLLSKVLSCRSSVIVRRTLSDAVATGTFAPSTSTTNTKPAPKKDTRSPKAKSAPKLDQENDFLYLSGMSKFASRKDLELVLGPHKPVIIDPLLTIDHHFSGYYGLKFQTAQEANSFQKFIGSQPKKIGSPSFFVHGAKWFDHRRMVNASSRNVNTCTVRLQLLDKVHIFADRFVAYFENYDLREERIDRVAHGTTSYGPTAWANAQTSHYLLHFDSHEEAVRAYVENQDKLLHGSKMKLELFLC